MTIAAKNIILTNGTDEIGLQTVLDTLNVHLAKYYADAFSNLEPSALEIDEQVGRKYIRVWVKSYGSRSAFCFLDYAGNIYKPATWKAPAKHIRGSIFDADCSWGQGLGPYGARYL